MSAPPVEQPPINPQPPAPEVGVAPMV
jgi:hypothetical protein